MNAVNNFKTIVITNVTTQTLVSKLAFNPENEAKAAEYVKYHNINKPMLGMLSVHYEK